jgi:hypothetical protein
VLHGRGVPAPHELSLSGTVALFQSFRRGGAAVAVGGAVTDVGAPPAELAKFGPFVLQGALETLASEEELRGVLQQVDWAACMHGPSRNHLFWKLCAAAKRVASPATVKATAALVFRIFGVQSPECAPRVWPVLLACDPSADDKVTITASGCRLVAALLSFPAQNVAPLLQGAKAFFARRGEWKAFGTDSRFTRVLEAALFPESPLPDPTKKAAVNAFLADEAVAPLALDPKGSFVIGALWKGMSGNPAARNRLADSLLAVEDELRQVNAPLWKLCGLHAYKTQKEEWSAKQQKQKRAKTLFADVLTDAAPSGAPEVPDEADAQIERVFKKRRAGAGQAAVESAGDFKVSGEQDGDLAAVLTSIQGLGKKKAAAAAGAKKKKRRIS